MNAHVPPPPNSAGPQNRGPQNRGYGILVEPLRGEVQVRRGGCLLAKSTRARVMYETRLQPTIYIPRDDLVVEQRPAVHVLQRLRRRHAANLRLFRCSWCALKIGAFGEGLVGFGIGQTRNRPQPMVPVQTRDGRDLRTRQIHRAIVGPQLLGELHPPQRADDELAPVGQREPT